MKNRIRIKNKQGFIHYNLSHYTVVGRYLVRNFDATNNNYLKALTKYKSNTKAGVKLALAILEKAIR